MREFGVTEAATRRPLWPTIRDVRRLVILAILIGFVIWRGRTLDRYDRVHGYGPYAPVRPTDTT